MLIHFFSLFFSLSNILQKRRSKNSKASFLFLLVLCFSRESTASNSSLCSLSGWTSSFPQKERKKEREKARNQSKRALKNAAIDFFVSLSFFPNNRAKKNKAKTTMPRSALQGGLAALPPAQKRLLAVSVDEGEKEKREEENAAFFSFFRRAETTAACARFVSALSLSLSL